MEGALLDMIDTRFEPLLEALNPVPASEALGAGFSPYFTGFLSPCLYFSGARSPGRILRLGSARFIEVCCFRLEWQVEGWPAFHFGAASAAFA
jgi:hypothetical protein